MHHLLPILWGIWMSTMSCSRVLAEIVAFGGLGTVAALVSGKSKEKGFAHCILARVAFVATYSLIGCSRRPIRDLAKMAVILATTDQLVRLTMNALGYRVSFQERCELLAAECFTFFGIASIVNPVAMIYGHKVEKHQIYWEE